MQSIDIITKSQILFLYISRGDVELVQINDAAALVETRLISIKLLRQICYKSKVDTSPTNC